MPWGGSVLRVVQVSPGYFNKVYIPFLMLNFEKPTALISLCVISYEYQNL